MTKQLKKQDMMSQLRNSLRGCANINHTITETKWLDTWHRDYAFLPNRQVRLMKRMHLEITTADGEKYIVKFVRMDNGRTNHLHQIIVNPISAYDFGAKSPNQVIWEEGVSTRHPH